MSDIIDFYLKDGKTRENAKFPLPVAEAGDATFYHCKWHDYIYYPEPVTNEEGVRYRAGYYDETGKYYGELKLYHSFPEEGLVCKYCNHRMTEEEFREMEELKCPNCDASFELVTSADAVKKDKVVTSEVRFTDKTEAQARRYIHEEETRLKPGHDHSRKRAAYDPHYDADSGTEYDKENNLDEKGYQRLSFGNNRDEDAPLALEEKDEREMAVALTVGAVVAFIIVIMSIISFMGPMG